MSGCDDFGPIHSDNSSPNAVLLRRWLDGVWRAEAEFMVEWGRQSELSCSLEDRLARRWTKQEDSEPAAQVKTVFESNNNMWIHRTGA